MSLWAGELQVPAIARAFLLPLPLRPRLPSWSLPMLVSQPELLALLPELRELGRAPALSMPGPADLPIRELSSRRVRPKAQT